MPSPAELRRRFRANVAGLALFEIAQLLCLSGFAFYVSRINGADRGKLLMWAGVFVCGNLSVQFAAAFVFACSALYVRRPRCSVLIAACTVQLAVGIAGVFVYYSPIQLIDDNLAVGCMICRAYIWLSGLPVSAVVMVLGLFRLPGRIGRAWTSGSSRPFPRSCSVPRRTCCSGSTTSFFSCRSGPCSPSASFSRCSPSPGGDGRERKGSCQSRRN